MRPYILAETNWKTVKETDYEVVVLPWGATEAHNYHLPYATDNLQCDYIAAEAARLAWEAGARVVVLPTVPFGVNTGQLDVRLDLNMNPSTQLALLRDLADVLVRQGFRKLVILNGHGGNDFRQMIREVQAQFPDLFISSANWYQAVPLRDYFEHEGDHAGEMETSVMLNIAPEMVRSLSEAGSGTTRRFKVAALREPWAWAQRAWTQVTADTGAGDPSRATAEKGRAYLDATVRKIATFLVDLAAVDTDDLYE